MNGTKNTRKSDILSPNKPKKRKKIKKSHPQINKMSVRKAVQSFYELVTPALIEGKLDNLSGSVSLLVNVASK